MDKRTIEEIKKDFDSTLQQIEDLKLEFEAIKNEMKELEKKKEFKYPIYAFNKKNGVIVKFESLNSGRAINIDTEHYKREELFTNFTHHTDEYVWQILPVCEETGFYHGQPVWAYDNNMGINRNLRFYDSINHCVFDNDGISRSIDYDFYEPLEGEWLPWMAEAFKKLEL